MLLPAAPTFKTGEHPALRLYALNDDWGRWGPMMGRRKAFDPSRFFIFCGNVLGSPYGSASPLTINPTTRKPYGPSFPQTTVRDDVR